MARILIIEDEKQLANFLKEGLERQGYAVDYLIDGDEGQQRLELYRADYDLAVIDLMLPHRDGFEITKSIREKEINVPILVLTARHSTNDKVRALDAGADDYLVKPFSIDELSARVRALLRRPKKSIPPVLKVENIILDTSSRQAYIDNKEIHLTLKEFRLLEYFMRHPNQVLTREQIYNQLWDFASNSFSNVIDVHMKNLRKKLKATSAEKMIETVQGVGYRLRR